MGSNLNLTSLSKERLGLYLVVLAAVGFGISPSFAKLAYHGGSEPLSLVAARFTICVLAMFVIAGARKSSLWVGPKLLYIPFVMGLLLAWNATAYLSAVREIDVSLAAALFYTFPLQVALFLWLFGRSSLSARQIGALFIGFAGVVLVISLNLSRPNIIGITLALGAGSGVALTSVLFARVADIENSIGLILWSMMVACLTSWFFVFSQGGLAFPVTRVGRGGFMVSMLGFSLAVIAYYLALPMIGPVRAAIVANLEPIIAVLMAMFLLNERLGPMQISGIILIILAVYLGGRTSVRESN